MTDMEFAQSLAGELERQTGRQCLAHKDGIRVLLNDDERIEIRLDNFRMMHLHGVSIENIAKTLTNSIHIVQPQSNTNPRDWPSVKDRLTVHLTAGMTENTVTRQASPFLAESVAVDYPDCLAIATPALLEMWRQTETEVWIRAGLNMAKKPRKPTHSSDIHDITLLGWDCDCGADWAWLYAQSAPQAACAVPFRDFGFATETVTPQSVKALANGAAKLYATAPSHRLTPVVHVFQNGKLVSLAEAAFPQERNVP